ncbi:hypothetical protein BCR37DRAFT_86437 [Protomyces lactucae-debilis]|uniref:Calpain catalytic domain-containing protein n=1 Tax=Protomyces lactucae-debilis TaxID=2754530 RepID=A0A1Y2F667_PROLT|nr:uncharacterized protein BCR37DRAFT_86437 [Protomyces lactucae-debilis]ORY79400.1 hypothetical protein BCR37DRAFT_86437 [Protomyces lactucae-debilis]
MPASAVEKAKAHSKNASLASLDGNLEKALGELILASDLYLDAIQHAAGDTALRQKLRELFDGTLEEAEKIKQRQKAIKGTGHAQRRPGEPARTDTGSYVRQPMQIFEHVYKSSRVIPKKEKMLLLQSSKLEETVCPIWNVEHIERAMQCTELFQTASSWSAGCIPGHELNDFRLTELIENPLLDSTDCNLYSTFRQNILNDCSFVCALIVADQWSNRFRTKLLTANLYPRDKSGLCQMSPLGKYMAKVWLHGSDRQVIIDDRLPVPNSGSVYDLLVFSHAYKDVAWPVLLEKIYHTIKGCSFEGSNSASDLYLLTGWVPEEIHLRAVDFDRDGFWSPIFTAWKKGQVLITTGSARLSKDEEADFMLTSNHSYAIIGMREDLDGKRLLSLQDPWGSSTSQKGNTFEVDYAKVSLLFGALFLSWDPRLWRYRELYHIRRDSGFHAAAPVCLYDDPQMVIANESAKSVEMLIVLSRHGQGRKCHIGMALFANDGYRQWLDQDSIASTDHLTSSDITLRCTIPPRMQYTLVIFQSWLDQGTLYSLAVHHNEETAAIQLLDAQNQHQRPADSQVFEGAWIAATAGGNANHSSFVKNPQYIVTLSEHSDLHCALEASSDVNVQIDLVMLPRLCTRAANPQGKHAVTSGKAYQRMTNTLSAKGLPPGRYAVVCSTWRPGELSTFKLTVLLRPSSGTTWCDPAMLPTWNVLPPLGYGKSHHQLEGCLGPDKGTAIVTWTSPAANSASLYVHSLPPRIPLQLFLAVVGTQRVQVACALGETSLTMEPIKLGVLPADTHYELTIVASTMTGARDVAFQLDLYANQPLTTFQLK